jgi:hypothetical protein
MLELHCHLLMFSATLLKLLELRLKPTDRRIHLLRETLSFGGPTALRCLQ